MNTFQCGKIQELLYSVFELFFPKVCASCLTYGQCMVWDKALCNRCDYLLRYSLVKPFSAVHRYKNPQVYSAGVYTHEVARCVLAFKNGGRTDLLSYFSDALVRVLLALLEEREKVGNIVLVPVPSSAASARRRGFVPAEMIGLELLRRLKPLQLRETQFSLKRLLKQRRAVSSSSGQKLLGVNDRRRRTKNSMVLKQSLAQWFGFELNLSDMKCVLIDDVLTTGATLKEAHDVLSREGIEVLGAVTIAAVPLRTNFVSERTQ